ncbi:MAG: hypothetical protein A3C07_04755 [Candidatus Sungbacteria bacterium RIFCSPHIGHO2_02_FULL_47_11]|uniref:Uncharacterized protein n=1 Tax=Candidatus Sungbacteria bacterium RIFCSPHIGHO2_02_FULL_47_11 TaxID=1802270 RepID=A0A1G2KN27_9BACT|nr:MAG: hypothetical protein A3C07_04755 [Candidatus Sungbacteria bacterium RIFCSPHIGHO2_02_FULL_47_11]
MGAGLPPQVPGEAVSVLPSSAVPLIDGAIELVGATDGEPPPPPPNPGVHPFPGAQGWRIPGPEGVLVAVEVAEDIADTGVVEVADDRVEKKVDLVSSAIKARVFGPTIPTDSSPLSH